MLSSRAIFLRGSRSFAYTGSALVCCSFLLGFLGCLGERWISDLRFQISDLRTKAWPSACDNGWLRFVAFGGSSVLYVWVRSAFFRQQGTGTEFGESLPRPDAKIGAVCGGRGSRVCGCQRASCIQTSLWVRLARATAISSLGLFGNMDVECAPCPWLHIAPIPNIDQTLRSSKCDEKIITGTRRILGAEVRYGGACCLSDEAGTLSYSILV